ncbi:MAG: hypothetical protein WD848_06330 [Dehalococcoidia bacterium]
MVSLDFFSGALPEEPESEDPLESGELEEELLDDDEPLEDPDLAWSVV